MYSSFAARYPLNGIYDHNILLNRLLKNGTELYEMKDRRDREAAAMEMRAQRGRWLLGYPNSVKAMEFDDPDAYWYKMDWAKINFNEQLQWQALGWNQNNWIGNAPTPASEFKTWLSLSVDEIAAAESLGYNYYTWKGTKVVINKAEYGLLKEPNKKIDVTLRLQILVNYGSLTVYVDNFMAGYDPAPSRGKQLNVKYTLVGGKNMEKTVNESETIRFDDMVV